MIRETVTNTSDDGEVSQKEERAKKRPYGVHVAQYLEDEYGPVPEDYVANLSCPCCKAMDIEIDQGLFWFDNCAHRRMQCPECGRYWDEHYALMSLDLDPPPLDCFDENYGPDGARDDVPGSEGAAGRIYIHYVTNSNTKGWVHTHGMDQFGLPELEMRAVPGFLAESAAKLLGFICDYMIDSGKKVSVGETMELSDHTAFRFVKADPIPEAEEHYETERWQVVEVEALM